FRDLCSSMESTGTVDLSGIRCSTASISAGILGPPNLDFNLYPLYEGGLCEAVITTPRSAPNSLTARETMGVEENPALLRTTWIPSDPRTPATSSENVFPWNRQS